MYKPIEYTGKTPYDTSLRPETNRIKNYAYMSLSLPRTGGLPPSDPPRLGASALRTPRDPGFTERPRLLQYHVGFRVCTPTHIYKLGGAHDNSRLVSASVQELRRCVHTKGGQRKCLRVCICRRACTHPIQ